MDQIGLNSRMGFFLMLRRVIGIVKVGEGGEEIVEQ